jgi:flavin reductase (DIM6/NTAB) family NADH-FMN oxidoreductase RutF
MGHWATGVAVVAARAEGRRCGLTATAVASLSLDPLLVLACIERDADTYACIQGSGAFAVSVLRADQERIARRFAAHDIARKFDGVAYREERTGSPVLEAALAWVDCRLWRSHEGGDHGIFIGEVIAGDASEGEPLIYYRSGYGGVRP